MQHIVHQIHERFVLSIKAVFTLIALALLLTVASALVAYTALLGTKNEISSSVSV